MAARRTAKVRIEGEDRLTPATKTADRSIRGLSRSIGTTAVAAFGAFSAAAATLVIGLREVFSATTDAENATARLEQAMSNAGTRTAASAAEFAAWADQVERTTTISSDQATQLAATALAFTQNNEQAREAVTVAADFAAATGKNVNEALLQVTKTLGGYAGELGEVIPELRTLTREQLLAGDAIDILAAKFGGSAAAETDTLTGALGRLRNEFRDLLADTTLSTGRVDDLTEAINRAADALDSQQLRDGLGFLINGFLDLQGLTLDGLLAIPRVVLAAEEAFHEFRLGVDDSAISVKTLESRASELGITVDRLREIIEAKARDTREDNRETRESARAAEAAAAANQKHAASVRAIQEAWADEFVERATREQQELEAAIRDTTAALDAQIASASRLGETTSAQLEQEIAEIVSALDDQRELLGANSDEYVRLEQIASRRIESLEARIQSLRDGNGDLAESIRDAGEASEGFTRIAGEQERRLDTLSGSVEDAGGSFGSLTGSVDAATEANRRYAESASAVVAAAEQIDRKLAFTRRVFDEIAAASGRAAAIQAAIDAGGTLELGGTRLRLPGPGGGSVLTSAPGLTGFTEKTTGFNVGGGTFTVQGATASSYASAAPVLRRKV